MRTREVLEDTISPTYRQLDIITQPTIAAENTRNTKALHNQGQKVNVLQSKGTLLSSSFQNVEQRGCSNQSMLSSEQLASRNIAVS